MKTFQKSCRGYISSRSFAGNWAPQHIQNIIIRNYCYNNNLHYLLSAAEYSIKNSYIVLKNLVSESKIIDGIICYSIHQLPSSHKLRNELLLEVILNRSIVYFCVEEIVVKDKKDIEDLNTILDVHRVVSELEPLGLK
jgi:sporadic carbohydrate cluster protein (TIGR04323 family)